MTPWEDIPEIDKGNLMAAHYFSVHRIAVGREMYKSMEESINKYPEWHDEEAIKREQEKIDEQNRLRLIQSQKIWDSVSNFFKGINEDD